MTTKYTRSIQRKWNRIVAVAHEAWGLPEGVHENFNGHRVVKTREIVLLSPTLRKRRTVIRSGSSGPLPFPVKDFYILAFARPTHFAQFEEAVKGVRYGGPANYYPGSVGSIIVSGMPYYHLKNSKAYPLRIRQVQSHFRTRDTEYPLSRSLANRYKKWRLRAFEEALRIAKEHGVGVNLHKLTLYPKDPYAPTSHRREETGISRSHDDLLQAARKMGFEIAEKVFPKTPPSAFEESYLLLTPKQSA